MLFSFIDSLTFLIKVRQKKNADYPSMDKIPHSDFPLNLIISLSHIPVASRNIRLS